MQHRFPSRPCASRSALVGLLLTLAVILGGVVAAPNATATTNAQLCTGRTAGEWSCAVGDYSATSRSWADRYYYAGIHNCTRYVAHRLAANGVADPGSSWGNAYDWSTRAPGDKNGTPAVGAIAQWGQASSIQSGHVAYVEEVGSDYIVTTDDAYGGVTTRQRIVRGTPQWPTTFLHIADVQAGSPRGSLDSATSPGPGAVQVAGWAVDTGSPTTPIDVQVVVGGQLGSTGIQITTVRADQQRPDVAAALGTDPAHGFSVSVATTRTGLVPVCLHGVNIGVGSTTLIGCQWVTVYSPLPVGSVDEVSSPGSGQVRVRGWAWDGDAPSASLAVHAYIGGPAGTPGAQGFVLAADRPRDDVNAAFAITGRHGFDATLATSWSGAVPVCLYAINSGPGDNTVLGCRTLRVVNPDPVGSVDEVSSPGSGQVRVRGWAWDGDAPSASLAVHVYVGGAAGTPGARGFVLAADQPRGDVNAAFAIAGQHGVDATLATGRTGPTVVCVYAINTGPGQNITLGCTKVAL